MILDRPNRARLAVMSLTEASATGQDDEYLAWHLLDHLPEQYRIDGLLHGQRWRSTPACRACRAPEAAGSDFEALEHVCQYLVGEPVDQALEDFLALGAELHGLDRMPLRMPSVLLGTFDVVAVAAAPRVQVSPEAIAFRPNRGAYVVFEPSDGLAAAPPGAPTAPTAPTAPVDERLAELCAVAGVAGAWAFAPGTRRPDRFDPHGLALTLCYLDEDPAEVAPALGEVLARQWALGQVRPQLAAPFETVRPPWS